MYIMHEIQMPTSYDGRILAVLCDLLLLLWPGTTFPVISGTQLSALAVSSLQVPVHVNMRYTNLLLTAGTT